MPRFDKVIAWYEFIKLESRHFHDKFIQKLLIFDNLR